MTKPERETREIRLAQALRANLRRRKGQARVRAEEDEVAGDEAAEADRAVPGDTDAAKSDD